jgi:antitoxin MazE
MSIQWRKGSAMQVSKWGNSLAIRLPAAVVEVLDLKEGDQVEVDVANARTLSLRRSDAGDRQALARLRKYRGLLPADFKFDRMEASERGR